MLSKISRAYSNIFCVGDFVKRYQSKPCKVRKEIVCLGVLVLTDQHFNVSQILLKRFAHAGGSDGSMKFL